MRKLLTNLALVCALFTPLVAVAASAQVILNPVCSQSPDATICKDNTKQDPGDNRLYGPDGILTRAARILAVIVGVVSLFVMIIAGIRYVLSGGDSSKVGAARNNLLYAIIGLVVASLAQFIVIFVLNRL